MICLHSIAHKVRHHECSGSGVMKLMPLFDCLQDAAAEHAELLGCGMEALLVQNRLWVLSRLKLQILRRPALKDELLVETWPNGTDRLFALRQYRISCGKEELVHGSSEWLLLDGRSFRPLSAAKEIAGLLPDNSERPFYFHDLDKIAEEECPQVSTCHVGASGIDLNRHLNNAVYASFMEDVLEQLAPERFERIDTLQINFLKAGKLHEEISCSGAADNNCFYISGNGYFRAKGTFKS